jgi:type IX secretion system PorP/SprF family membrane protein
MRKWIPIALLCLGSLGAKSQDIHFSQFYNTPLFTNPAATGYFDGTYRFNGVVRRQWAAVSAQPYQTFGGAIDMNSPFNLKGTGVGINVAQDVTGLSTFSTFSANVSLAGRLKLGSNKSWIIGAGGAFGYLSQSVDYSKLKFESQFDGKYFDPNMLSNEFLGSINYAWTNVSLGGFIQKKWSERTNVLLGYSTYNLFLQNRGSGLAFYPEQRQSFQALTSFKLLSRLNLTPGVQVMFQGQSQEYLFGTSVKYYLKNTPLEKQAIMLGGWARLSDAGIVSLGFQQNQLTIGATYDINYSPFNVATNYRGGWEFAVIYTIATVRENVKRLRACPNYF